MKFFPEVLDMPEWLDVHHRVMHGNRFHRLPMNFIAMTAPFSSVRWSMIPWLDRTSGTNWRIMYPSGSDWQQNLFLKKRLIQRLETENGSERA